MQSTSSLQFSWQFSVIILFIEKERAMWLHIWILSNLFKNPPKLHRLQVDLVPCPDFSTVYIVLYMSTDNGTTCEGSIESL